MWVWLLGEVIPGTNAITDIGIWAVAIVSILGLLAAGRKIISGPLEKEQADMRAEFKEFTEAIRTLAHAVEQLVVRVAVIEDRQKRIARSIDVDDPPGSIHD